MVVQVTPQRDGNHESATARARTRRPQASARRHLLVLVGLASLAAVLLASACGQRDRVADRTAWPSSVLPAQPSASAPTGPALHPAPRPGPAADRASTAATPGTTAPQPARKNPFGVMLPSKLTLSSRGMQVAKDLGAVYFRPEAVLLDWWEGSCPSCDVALRAGLKLVLTVRNSGARQFPASPPRDLAAYRRALGEVLDRFRPEVLVVENEENSKLFYVGTPEEYGVELKAACQVAHQKGVACTNGGLVSSLVALLVYDYYLETGQAAAARDFASRAFEQKQQRLLGTAKVREQIRKGKALLQAYRSAGLDYVNFHWYIADTRALEEAVAYLEAQTGLPVITNEIGQFTDDPNQTTAVMGKVVELGLPIAVWFGLDGPKARGLVDPDGRLRATGEAFRRFNQKAFAGRN